MILGERLFLESHNLGNAFADLGSLQRGFDFYEQRLTIARELGDRPGEAETLRNYGIVLIDQGEVAKGLAMFENCLAIYQQIDHPYVSAMTDTVAHVRAHGVLPDEDGESHPLDTSA